ncbi:hypothetical protein ACWEOW_06870 [Monashia sp. NPDC004114]
MSTESDVDGLDFEPIFARVPQRNRYFNQPRIAIWTPNCDIQRPCTICIQCRKVVEKLGIVTVGVVVEFIEPLAGLKARPVARNELGADYNGAHSSAIRDTQLRCSPGAARE